MPITFTQTISVHKFDIPEPVPEMVELPPFQGSIQPGSIPSQVKRLDMAWSLVTELVEGAIPDSVTHLWLRDLNEKMVIPSSVKHLFVLNFRKSMIQFVPSTVTHLYVHVWDAGHAPTNRIHYICSAMRKSKSFLEQDGQYEVSDMYSEHFFKDPSTIVKRTPKVGSIIVGETYTELTIKCDQGDLVFPEDFNHKLRSGDIPSGTKRIRFNDDYDRDIGPDIITDAVTQLVLGKGYARPLLSGAIPESTDLLIHADNLDYAPRDRPFFLYRAIIGGNIILSAPMREAWTFRPDNVLFPNPYQDPTEIVGGRSWVTTRITPKPTTTILVEPQPTILPKPQSTVPSDDLATKFEAFSKDVLQALAKIDDRLGKLEAKVQ